MRKSKTNNFELREKLSKHEGITNGSLMGEKLNKYEKINKGNLSRETILGIVRDENTDVFYFNFKEIVENARTLKPVKYNIIKIVSSFSNPLGVMQPIMISFKVLLQELCKRKLQWDEEVSDKPCKVWEVNLKELEEMDEIEVLRLFDDGDEKPGCF